VKLFIGSPGCRFSNATAAQSVDVSGVETAEILAALGAVIQVGFKTRIALALAVYLIV
jgi:hypothetical protein